MVKTVEGQLIAKGKKFAIVVSRFNDFISKRLLEGAIDTLTRHGVKEGEIEAVWVPGAFEIPVVANKLAKSKKFDAVICIGAIIKGSTPHFEYVASEAAKGVAKVSLDTGIPVIFGVITAENLNRLSSAPGQRTAIRDVTRLYRP